jgi:hypothetical protein
MFLTNSHTKTHTILLQDMSHSNVRHSFDEERYCVSGGNFASPEKGPDKNPRVIIRHSHKTSESNIEKIPEFFGVV